MLPLKVLSNLAGIAAASAAMTGVAPWLGITRARSSLRQLEAEELEHFAALSPAKG